MMSSTKPSAKGTMQSTEIHSIALPEKFWNAANKSTGSTRFWASDIRKTAFIIQDTTILMVPNFVAETKRFTFLYQIVGWPRKAYRGPANGCGRAASEHCCAVLALLLNFTAVR
jgi:hypothetical protein